MYFLQSGEKRESPVEECQVFWQRKLRQGKAIEKLGNIIWPQGLLQNHLHVKKACVCTQIYSKYA